MKCSVQLVTDEMIPQANYSILGDTKTQMCRTNLELYLVCPPVQLPRHTGHIRQRPAPVRGTVLLQDGVDGERTAELHLSFRREESCVVVVWWWWWRRGGDHHLLSHCGQLRETLLHSFEVTTRHLLCDFTVV